MTTFAAKPLRFLPLISSGIYQGRFSPEGNVWSSADNGGSLLLDVPFSSEVFKSFRRPYLNSCDCWAPAVYLLTMYICFMKLFNLQFTFLQRQSP